MSASDGVVEQPTEAIEPVPRPPRPEPASSLKARMKARQAELQDRTTEIFPVPLFDAILAVELKAVEWEETEQALEKHLRRPQRMMLLTAADEVVAATVAFYEIGEDDSLELIEDAEAWSDIATAYLDEDFTAMPPATLERVALISLISEQGVMALSGQYRQWLGGANVGISKAVRRDFKTTP
jgi:hypothetical protein